VPHFTRLIRDTFRELGYEPGRNLNYIERWAGASEDQLRRDAAELAERKVDAIIAGTSAEVRGAVGPSKTIPIVAVDMESDPVANG
jgi:putative ABC transport system substrate-binding protein